MTSSLGLRVAAAAVGLLTVGLAAAPALAAPPVIHFDGYPTINDPASARAHLPGTSRAFKVFAAREGKTFQDYAIAHHATRHCIAMSGITVSDYVDGYAIGGAGGCGGYTALWTNRARGGTTLTHWRQVIGTQDAWYCGDLHRYRVPSALVGDTCAAPKLGTSKPYHQDWLAPAS